MIDSDCKQRYSDKESYVFYKFFKRFLFGIFLLYYSSNVVLIDILSIYYKIWQFVPSIYNTILFLKMRKGT